jgi:DNA-binding response OmpR family regulator
MDTSKTILVVEDERPLLVAIKKKLEINDFEVVTARSVQQAEEYIDSIDTVSAVWLDHYLFGQGDGLDIVAYLKNHEEAKQIPIFVVSNTATPAKKQSYLELGVTEYYTKSDYRLDQIIERIKEAVA